MLEASKQWLLKGSASRLSSPTVQLDHERNIQVDNFRNLKINMTPSTDSLRKNYTVYFRPPGRISSNRCRSQPYWMNSKRRRIGFKLPNKSSTNHLKILNYPAYIKINFNISSIKPNGVSFGAKKMIQIYSNHSPPSHPVIPLFWENKLLVNWYWKSTSTSGIHCQFLQDSRLPPSGDRCCCGSMDEIHLQKYVYILYTYLICTVYTCVLIINMLYHTVKYIHIRTHDMCI